jgi:hypothetical protein
MNKEVSFELAKLLKEKGFDVPVRNYYLQKEKGNYLHEGFEDSYWGDNRIVNWNKDVVGIKPFEGFLSAPTISEVVMWLYEKKSLWILALPTVTGHFAYKIVDVQLDPKNPIERPPYKDVSANDYNSPTEAYEAAIEYCLTNLI